MEKSRKRLCGAKFELIDCDGRVIACGTTDEKGLLCFNELSLGKYFIREIQAPLGYRASKEIYPIDLTPQSCHKTLEVINEKILGDITIIKTGD